MTGRNFYCPVWIIEDDTRIDTLVFWLAFWGWKEVERIVTRSKPIKIFHIDERVRWSVAPSLWSSRKVDPTTHTVGFSFLNVFRRKLQIPYRARIGECKWIVIFLYLSDSINTIHTVSTLKENPWVTKMHRRRNIASTRKVSYYGA